MTRREAAIKSCEDRIRHLESVPPHYYGKRQRGRAIELEKVKIKALRPVSREQVEKMKKEPVEGGYDELYAPTYKCPECGFENIGSGNFCRNCGCLHTDKAVEMVMERLPALNDGKGD